MFCQSQAFPITKKARKKPDFVRLLILLKKAKGVEKRQNFKTWLQKSRIGNPAVL